MLERDEIALELKRALRCEVARDAVLMLVERALRHEHRFCAELVRRCDVDGETTAAVAGALHLSPRQFFRYRAHAMEAIGVELEATLTRTRSHRPSAGAARAVVLGRLLLSRVAQADVSSAMRHFERAVTIDPLCVEAYAGMSIGWLLLSRELAVTPVHAHAKALSLAKRAVALDPHSAAAHSAFARVALDSGLGRAIAAPHVSEALSLDPFDARAHVANWNLALIDGDLGAAERSGGQAISLEPASFSNALCQMATTFYRCDYSATVEQAGELIAIEPRSRAVRVYLADALDASGRPEETLALLQPGDRHRRRPVRARLGGARARADRRPRRRAPHARQDAAGRARRTRCRAIWSPTRGSRPATSTPRSTTWNPRSRRSGLADGARARSRARGAARGEPLPPPHLAAPERDRLTLAGATAA